MPLRKARLLGVVVPHGVLFRGSGEGKIRKQLIEENLLDAVVGLPANLFYGTGVPAAILVFRKQKPDKSVVFIDASREYDDAKTQNRLADQHLEKIIATYKARSEVDKYAYVADFQEINENDFNLNIPRYVGTFEEEEEIDIRAVQEEIDDLDAELAPRQRTPKWGVVYSALYTSGLGVLSACFGARFALPAGCFVAWCQPVIDLIPHASRGWSMHGHQLLGFNITRNEHRALRVYCEQRGITMTEFALHFLQGPITTVHNGRDPMEGPARESRRHVGKRG